MLRSLSRHSGWIGCRQKCSLHTALRPRSGCKCPSSFLIPPLARGQSLVEFIIVLPLFLLIIAGAVGFGQLLYTKLATQAASWAAVRQSIATLNQDRGLAQARQGALYTLSGFGLNPEHAQQQLTVWGQWGRGTQVRARVCYNVPTPPVPLGEAFVPQTICSSVALPVYQWKSKW